MDEWSVYFATCKDNEIMKVGYSKNPFKRLVALRTGCPYELNIGCLLVVPNKKNAEWLEWMVHRTLAHRRMHGEWFSANTKYTLKRIKKDLIAFNKLLKREKIKRGKYNIFIDDMDLLKPGRKLLVRMGN